MSTDHIDFSSFYFYFRDAIKSCCGGLMSAWENEYLYVIYDCEKNLSTVLLFSVIWYLFKTRE